MKKITLITLFLLSFFCSFSQHTFSIVAVDPTTGEVGSAGATCLDGGIGGVGAAIINELIPGKGGVCSQAQICIPNINLTNAITQMNNGLSPQEIIDWLTTNDQCAPDFEPEIRQYGVVDLDDMMNPRAAAFTGGGTLAYANHITGPNYAIQGNILLGPEVLTGMENGFLNTPGSFADKLMGALQGANIVGADSRCASRGTSSATAYLRVYQPTDDPTDPYLEIILPTVPFGVEPIDSIQTLYDDFLMSMLPFGCTNNSAHNYDPNAVNDDGSCETCDDGIQNGDETDIDCGGILCAPCCLLEFTQNTIVHSTCNLENGSIEIQVTGGIPPVLYSIDNVEYSTSNFFQNLAAGQYTAYVKDGNDCQVERSFMIEESEDIAWDFIVKNEQCNMENGSIEIIFLSGTPPFLVSFEDGPFNAEYIFEDLPMNDYQFEIRDANQCNGSDQVTVLNIEGPTINATSTNATCNVSNGTINIIAMNGTAPYTYALDNLSFTDSSIFENLEAGNYTAKVRDQEGCDASQEITVNNSNGPIIMIQKQNSDCNSMSGEIVINGTSGTPPYTFALDDDSFSSTNSFTDLAPSTYIAKIKDAANCITEERIEIEEENTLTAQVNITPSSCGENNGQLNIIAMNGQPPYEFSLDDLNYTSINIFEDLNPGEYTIYVKDNDNCKTTLSNNQISSSTGVQAELSVEPASCNGASNGSFIIQNLVGESPFEFSINEMPFTTDTLFSNLNAAVYNLLIRDQAGCTRIFQIEIAEPEPLNLELSFSADSITSLISGGTPPFSYLWSDGTIESFLLNPIDSVYKLSVTDSNNCIIEKVINAPVGQSNIFELLGFSIYPNPISAILHLNSTEIIEGESEFYIFDVTGREMKSFQVKNFKSLQLNVTSWPDGTYFIKVKNKLGYGVSKMVILH